MRGGAGQKFNGYGLYPITELESENHQSMLQQNRNMGPYQSNGGYNSQQNNYNSYQQQPKYQSVREENQKYENLEKIFSDTDDSASRLNDSILDQCDNLVPKENQRQFSQNVLNQYQNYRQQTNKEFSKNNYGGHYSGNDKSLDLTLNLTKTPSHNNMILGGLHENSINESLLNIVNELGGDGGRLRHQGTNNNLNDTQMMYQKYDDTVKMMSQLQRQLGSSIDTNQASLLKSDRFRNSLDSSPNGGGYSPQGLKNIPNSVSQQNQVYKNGNTASQYGNFNNNLAKQPNQMEQNYYTNVKDFKNLQQPQQPNSQSSTQISSSEYRSNSNNLNSNGFDNGLAQSNFSQNFNGQRYNQSSPQKNLNQSNQTNLMNSNGFGIYSSPNSVKSSNFSSNSPQYQSPQSLQSSHYSAFQNQGMNSQQRRAFNQEQKAILKQTEQRMQSSVDPFLYQRRMEQEIISDRNYQKMVEEELPVFCINCEEYIKLTDVDRHAERECEVIQKRKEQQKNNPYFNQQRHGQTGDSSLNDISEKILQLESQINTRIQKLRYQPLTPQTNQLIQVSESILKSASAIRLNNDNTAQIQQPSISASNDKNVGLIILLDRIIFLGDEKALKVRYYKERGGQGRNDLNGIKDREILQLEEELRKLDGMTQKERENVQYWKMQSEMMEQIKKQDVNNLRYVKDSHQYQLVKNLQSEKDSETQSSVGFSSLTSDLIVTNQLQVINPITQNSEDRKKIFFSEALNLKYKLPLNHPGRQISMQDLYDIAQKQNIPQQKWAEFIRNKMYSMG